MKKILSIILTLAMLLPMSICTFASEEIEIAKSITDGTLENGFGGSAVTEAVDGFMGKTADDKVLKLTNPNGGQLTGGGLAGTDKDHKVLKNYYVMKFNYLPVDNTGLTLRTANNNPIVSAVAYNKFNQGQWNSVVIYVDYTAIDSTYDYTTLLQNSLNVTNPLIPDDAKEKVCPKGYVYINGVAIEEGYMANRLQDRFGMWNTYYHPTTHALTTATGPNTDWRFYIGTTNTAYIDDLYIYQTDTLPDAAALSAPPVLASGEKYNVSGNTIKVNTAITVAELKASAGADYTVLAYTDNTYTTALSDTALLTTGNAVAVAKDSRLAYYTAEEQYKSLTNGTLGTVFTTSLSTETVNGSMGKAADDKVLKVSNDAGKDYFIGGGGLQSVTETEVLSKYYVLKFNYMPINNSQLTFRTDNNDAVTNTVGAAKFNQNEWNSVCIYVDYSKIDADYDYTTLLSNSYKWYTKEITDSSLLIPASEREKVCPVGYVYVNGAEAATPYTPYRLQGRFGMYNHYYYPTNGGELKTNNTVFRLGFGSTAGMGGYIDDLYIYQTDVLPDAAALSARPTVTSTDKIIVDGENLCVEIGTTVADVQAAAGAGCTVRAYTDSAYTNIIASTAKLFAGDKVVVEKDSRLAYYTVTNAEISKKLINGTLENGFGVSSALTASTEEGSMGKTTDDKVLKLSQESAGDGYLNGGGLVSVNSDNKVTSKYYVLKFNYKPTNNTGLAFRTANGGSVINPVAYTLLKQDEWNSVVIYVDYTGIDENYDYTTLLENSKNKTTPLIPESEKPKVCPVGYVFVNGVQQGEGYMPTRLQDRFGMYNVYYHPTTGAETTHDNNDFRLGFGNTAAGKTAEFDDLYVYQTDVLPDAAALSALPTLKSADENFASVNSNVVTAKAGTTADIMASTDGRVKIFAGTTETDTIAEDTLISVVGPNGAINAYNVSIFDATVDGQTVTASATDALAGSRLFIAEYKNGEMVKVVVSTDADVDENGDLSLTYTKTDAQNTVRAFLFENAESIRPLSGSIDN